MAETIEKIPKLLPENHELFSIVVIGSGITGLVSASELLKSGQKSVVILEDYKHVGGNHIDWSSNGYTFDIGSLIFQDDSPLVAHFPELLQLYVPIEPSWARLNPQGLITSYPISVKDDILRAGPVVIARILLSVLYARLFQRKLFNAQDFARYWIGSYLLARSGLQSYMKRFYGISPVEIDIDLARKRMLWISEHASLRNILGRLFKRRHEGATNQQMARPREGFGALYKPVADRLAAAGVPIYLDAGMSNIDKADGKFVVRLKGRTIVADRIISTIPIERTQALCNIPSVHKLETITLLALFFSFSGERGFSESVVYNFSHDGAWKRLTMYSDFYGTVDDRQYFGVEVIFSQAGNSLEAAIRDFRQHSRDNGLFDGDLRLEGSKILENAYPIYKTGAAPRAAQAIDELRRFGIESFGRQGGFNYQPTARSSTVEAEAALREASLV